MHTQRDIKQANELMQVMTGKKKLEDCEALGKPKRKHTQHEAEEQKALFRWAELQKGKYPELDMMFAIPNGGSRHMLEAVNLKKQGVKRGVPDICLPVPKGTYHGLYIELKRSIGNSRVSKEQNYWIEKLLDQGYDVQVCYGWDDAKSRIMDYLKGW